MLHANGGVARQLAPLEELSLYDEVGKVLLSERPTPLPNILDRDVADVLGRRQAGRSQLAIADVTPKGVSKRTVPRCASGRGLLRRESARANPRTLSTAVLLSRSPIPGILQLGMSAQTSREFLANF